MKAFSAGDMKVAAVSIPQGVPAVVAFDGSPASLVVTGFGAELSVNAQFMRSLGSVIYVYPFGDNVGKARLNITAFMNSCGGAGGNAGTLLQYYGSKKLSKSSTPISVAMAGASFTGYLVAATISGDQATGIIQGTLDFAVTDSAGGAGSSPRGGGGVGGSPGGGGGFSENVITLPPPLELVDAKDARNWQVPTLLGRIS